MDKKARGSRIAIIVSRRSETTPRATVGRSRPPSGSDPVVKPARTCGWIRAIGRHPELWAVLSGLVTVSAYFGPWPLVIPGAALLVATWMKAGTVRQSVAVGLLFGIVYFALLDRPFAAYSPRGALVLIPFRALTMVPVALAFRFFHGRLGGSAALAFPIAWVGGEYLRMLGPMAIPSGSLALPLTELDWLLQTADIAGSYGISVIAAVLCGLLAEVLWRRVEGRPGSGVRIAGAVVLVAVAFVHGSRTSEAIRKEMKPGPVLAVIQPDVPVDRDTAGAFDPDLLMRDLRQLSESALREEPRPELVLWPEAPTGFPVINAEWPDGASERADFKAWVGRQAVPVLYGSIALLPRPGRPEEPHSFNAVTRYDPGAATEPERQFKRRLFPGGETMPWSDVPVVGRIMDWLGGARSSSRMSWLDAGAEWHPFQVTNQAGIWRHRVVVCSEGLFPETSGTFAVGDGPKPIDFLTLPGNLGGFARNRAQRWFFSSLRVRAVEARVGIACSINTGISGFIRPDGGVEGLVTNRAGRHWTGLGAPELPRIADLQRLRAGREAELASDLGLRAEVTRRMEEIQKIRQEAGVTGHSVRQVWTHPKVTFYSRMGDWLGAPLCGLTLAGAVAGSWPGRGGRTPASMAGRRDP